MKNYLTLIRKSDFTDLFKFGYLFIDAKSVVEFDGDVKSLWHNTSLRDRIVERLNQFDYSFTVILVHFQNDHVENGKLYIQEVLNIFALDEDAKREIEISYDKRIRIENPIWPNFTTLLQERFLYEDAKKGPYNIWTILKIEETLADFQTILTDEALKEIAHEVQNDLRPKGNLSFWIYLLRYERHGFFPMNTAGYFMDIVNVYINTIQNKEMPSEVIESTGIFHKIDNLGSSPKKIQLVDFYAALAQTSEGQNFFNKIKDAIACKYNPVIVALLFLI